MADFTSQQRQIIYKRDNWQCQGCGVNVKTMTWRSIQHRKARGQGGKSTMDNGVTLCGSATSAGCHLRCENRDSDMVSRGFVVWSWQEPSDIPVERFDGVVLWLLADGGIRFSWQPE